MHLSSEIRIPAMGLDRPHDVADEDLRQIARNRNGFPEEVSHSAQGEVVV